MNTAQNEEKDVSKVSLRCEVGKWQKECGHEIKAKGSDKGVL